MQPWHNHNTKLDYHLATHNNDQNDHSNDTNDHINNQNDHINDQNAEYYNNPIFRCW